MAKVSVGPLGVNAAVPGKPGTPPPPGSETKGWSASSARRNKRFLQSIDPAGLWGVGIAVTLTVRETPDSAADWKRALDALTAQWRRWGLIRHHMVTEWQKRGTPHLHAVAYFDPDVVCRSIVGGDGIRWVHGPMRAADWQARMAVTAQLIAFHTTRVWSDRLAPAWGASRKGQHVVEVMNPDRWAQYLAKHAARGADHYQRQRDTLPASWHTTGRLWSKGGSWPTREEVYDTDMRTYHRLRRWVRRWQRSRAQRKVALGTRYRNPQQVEAGRRELAALGRVGQGSREFSEVRGISVHLGERWTQALLDLASRHETATVVERKPPPPKPQPATWPSCPWPRPVPPRGPLGPLARQLLQMAKAGPRSDAWLRHEHALREPGPTPPAAPSHPRPIPNPRARTSA